MPRCGSPWEPSGCTRRSPALSARTVQRALGGIDPMGRPVASSVRNSSPSPPRARLPTPATIPTRSSGSAPGASGWGRAHAAAARRRKLTGTRCGERRIELRDGEVDVRIRVRAGDESGLEGRGSEVHAAFERCAVPAGVQRRVRALARSEEHTSELQSRLHLVCRLLLEKKKKTNITKRRETRSTSPDLATQTHAPTQYRCL